jgi:3-oxoacyl-[acyl-carrier-protein] synthase III
MLNKLFFTDSAVQFGDMTVSNPDANFVSASHKKRFEESVGISYHFVESEKSSLKLALRSAEKLLDGNPFYRESVGSVIVMSQSMETLIPSNSVIIQGMLGLSSECYCLDLNQGCSGFNYVYTFALERASKSGKLVLVINSDTYQAKLCKEDNTSLLFSDAAVAYLVGPKQSDEIKILSEYYWNDGSRYEAMYYTKDLWLKDSKGISSETIYMNGPKIYSFATGEVVTAIKSFLDKNLLEPSKIAKLYLHQANRQLIMKVANACGFKKHQVPININLVANTVSASIPILIHSDNTIVPKNSLILVVGFGVGLSISIVLYKT